MIGVLHRISRNACLPCDRPWVDALFTEAESVAPGGRRAAWLLGTAPLVLGGYAAHLAAALTRLSFALLIATLSFGVLGLIEFEVGLPEDDHYLLLSLASLLGLFMVAIGNIRHQAMPVRS